MKKQFLSMPKTTLIPLLLFTIYLLIGCNQPSTTADHSNEPKASLYLVTQNDIYLLAMEELNQNFFQNYWEIEKMILKQLEEKGEDYFIQNDCYQILGKYESTLKLYCEICEKLNVNNDGDLLTSYLHLNDIENVKKQFTLMQNEPNAFIYEEFQDYMDSGETLEGKYVSIKYDERVKEFAEAVFSHVEEIENYLIQEWDGKLPPKIRVILLYSDGPGPYNVDLNETYLPVKSRPLSSSMQVAGHIVHETFHLVNNNLLQSKSEFETGMEVYSFKFLDEGFAQLTEAKFKGSIAGNRAYVDDYARKTIASDTFNIEDLNTNWSMLFSTQGQTLYSLAFSFSYFLEDKYGEEKNKALFLPTTHISEKTWLAYVEGYLGSNLDDLLVEWQESLNTEKGQK